MCWFSVRSQRTSCRIFTILSQYLRWHAKLLVVYSQDSVTILPIDLEGNANVYLVPDLLLTIPMNLNLTTHDRLITDLLYLPSQICLPNEGERVISRRSKLTQSLGRTNSLTPLGEQNSLTPYGEQNSLTRYWNNNVNFRLARDQVVLLETAANLQTISSQFFLVLSKFMGITKHLMTGRAGNSFIPLDLEKHWVPRGNKTQSFPWATHEVLISFCHVTISSQ